MPKTPMRGRASPRAAPHSDGDRSSRTPEPNSSVYRLQLRALAKICRALGDEGRLRLFKRILAAGTVGIDAGAFVHSSELDVLIEAGLVSPLDSSGEGRLRAEPNLLGLALVFLFGDDQ